MVEARLIGSLGEDAQHVGTAVTARKDGNGDGNGYGYGDGSDPATKILAIQKAA